MKMVYGVVLGVVGETVGIVGTIELGPTVPVTSEIGTGFKSAADFGNDRRFDIIQLETTVRSSALNKTMVKKCGAVRSSEKKWTISSCPTIPVGLGGSPTGECPSELLKSTGGLAAREIGATKQ